MTHYYDTAAPQEDLRCYRIHRGWHRKHLDVCVDGAEFCSFWEDDTGREWTEEEGDEITLNRSDAVWMDHRDAGGFLKRKQLVRNKTAERKQLEEANV